jgi:uncharacterized membrane protein YedE/YeeE
MLKSVWNYIRKESWSPYAAGALLGVVGILAVWLSESLLGASGTFENFAGMVGKAVAPEKFDNLYFNFIMPPGITWSLVLFIGTFIGGFVGAASSGTLKWGKKESVNSDEQWKRIFGKETWKRWFWGFIGAIIIEYGAGIAGGCTSGLAISGGMLLAPSAFIFIAAMFASGIVTALIIYRARY